jgi:hypothetical protein
MKKNRTLLLLTMLATMQPAVSHAISNCELDRNSLAAHYDVSILDTSTGKSRHKQLSLLRDGNNRVLHVYPDNAISELWEHTVQDTLRVVHYFDEDARAIEYDPSEIQARDKQAGWSVKYQLFSSDLIDRMQLASSSGTGCDSVQHYSMQKDGSQMTLDWMPQLRLAKRFVDRTGNKEVRWQLQGIDYDKAATQAAFERREAYFATDYTDIGDNESDPFLVKMINQGFVSHGASGFYNTQGEQLHSASDGHGGH